MPTRTRLDRARICRWLFAAATLLLAGCHHDPDPVIVGNLMKFFLAAELIDSQRKRAGRAFKHFINRRIIYLLTENSSWGNETPSYPSMTQRLTSELNGVIAFLDVKVGTSDNPGPLGGGTDAATPPHIDLADVAKLFTSDQDSDPAVTTRKSGYLDNRRTAVESIAWRAAALHHELWNGADSATTTTLNSDALEQVVNRRLRIYERMHLTDDALAPDSRAWSVASATSWKDGMRAVVFEYPFVNLAADGRDTFSIAIAAAGQSLDNIPGFTHDKVQLRYGRSAHFPTTVAANWQLASDGYVVDMVQGGLQPSQILDNTLPSTWPIDAAYADFWNRPWIFCDHTVALLHVEALRFGLVRRKHDNDAEFNSAASAGVHLTPLLGATAPAAISSLMNNGSSYFESTTIAAGDLQIGDHIIFWNNYFMRAMMGSDFGLENTIIADAADEAGSNSLNMIGHGMALLTYADFNKEMYNGINKIFDSLRSKIATLGSVIYHPIPQYRFALIAWAPFGEKFFNASDNKPTNAWWIRVQLADTNVGKIPALSLADAQQAFPRSITIDISTNVAGQGHQQPPDLQTPNHAADWKDSIYIPLSVPNGVQGGWEKYLKDGAADPDVALLGEIKLDDFKADSSFIPGLHFKGAASKIPVIRPKVIK